MKKTSQGLEKKKTQPATTTRKMVDSEEALFQIIEELKSDLKMRDTEFEQLREQVDKFKY